MKQYPILRSWLKEFEPEEYRGVTVEYVSGKPAVLSIYDDDDALVEEVDLFQYTDKDSLHAMMANKGFVRMNKEEIDEMKRIKRHERNMKTEEMVNRRKERLARQAKERAAEEDAPMDVSSEL